MSGLYSVEQSLQQPSSANLQNHAEAYRRGARTWAFAAGSVLGVEIAAGESLVKTVALMTVTTAGALYCNERRTHLQREAEIPSPDAGQQG